MSRRLVGTIFGQQLISDTAADESAAIVVSPYVAEFIERIVQTDHQLRNAVSERDAAEMRRLADEYIAARKGWSSP